MKMNRNKLFLTVLFILVFGNLSNAQEYEEITNQYITNHSFESDQINTLQCIKENADGLRGYALNQPTGWTVEGADVKKGDAVIIIESMKMELVLKAPVSGIINFHKKAGDLFYEEETLASIQSLSKDDNSVL